jgi:hypothetical protein
MDASSLALRWPANIVRPFAFDRLRASPVHAMLEVLAYATSLSSVATASDAMFVQLVLYSGIRPDTRIASAHAEVTWPAHPRPR